MTDEMFCVEWQDNFIQCEGSPVIMNNELVGIATENLGPGVYTKLTRYLPRYINFLKKTNL